MRGQALHGFDRSPADQPRALFGDPAAVHLRVGLVVFRCQSSPTCQLRWLAEAADVPDLGNKHRAEYWADPRNGLNGLIAGVSTQPVSNQLGEQLDLAV